MIPQSRTELEEALRVEPLETIAQYLLGSIKANPRASGEDLNRILKNLDSMVSFARGVQLLIKARKVHRCLDRMENRNE